MYMKGCFWVACLGLFQLVSFWINFKYGYDWRAFTPFNKWGPSLGGLGLRINSTFSEPASLGVTLGPAFFIAFYELILKSERFITRNQCIAILVAYVLSYSSVAYMCIFTSIILITLNFGLLRYVFFAIPVSIILFNLAYSSAPEFRDRVDGMKVLFIDKILEKNAQQNENNSLRVQNIKSIIKQVHGSSFVLYNNYHIATENFKNNPMFGSGLGSHEYAFDKYNLSYIIGGIYEFNTTDANSMFLRLLSETGLMGVLFALIFIFKFFVAKSLFGEEDEEYWLISNAILVIIIAQLLRQGNYTYSGFFLFGWMYYYNSLNYKEYRKQLFMYKG